MAKADQSRPDNAAERRGGVNLSRHIENVRQFGLPVVVAVYHLDGDTPEEFQVIRELAAAQATEAVMCTHWADGGAGAEALAQRVAELCDHGSAQFAPLYDDGLSLFDKINTVATRIYRAEAAVAEPSIRRQLERWEAAGYGHLPVCMAKTQYSFSTDPAKLGAPTGHVVDVREVRLAAGAGFVVAICGEIMTMPGLPRVPSAETIRFGADGQVEGLF